MFKELKIRDSVLIPKWDFKVPYHQGLENIAEELGRRQESKDRKKYCEMMSPAHKMFI